MPEKITRTLLVVDNPDRWSLNVPEVSVVAARTYLTDPNYSGEHRFKVLNMCRSYRYQSAGYYVSLLAEARGHRPIPTTGTILDFRSQSIVKAISSDLEEVIQRSLSRLHSDRFTLSIYFSRNLSPHYDRLARMLYNLFPAPLLRAHFVKGEDGWMLSNIGPIPTADIPEEHRSFVVQFAEEYFARRTAPKKPRRATRFDLAILYDETEKTRPSNEKALRRFVRAAEALQIGVDFIDVDDYGTLNEYDGLFIRQTTAANSHTYRFARKAEALGLVVIDDPESILRCANKVYLAELLAHHALPAPRTVVIHRDNWKEAARQLGLPCILKQPDSSFSQGVVKASTEAELAEKVDLLLAGSELIIGQAFVPTEFDWRIGIIDGQALYACKYYMARGHWQIYHHGEKDWGNRFVGNFECVPIEDAPHGVVELALKATSIIGDGLYGVDLKVVDGQPMIIEVNDNPSIDGGVEDAHLKDALYEKIMQVFLKRMEARRARILRE